VSGIKESRQGPRIVVGVDGSDGSNEALRWAIADAKLRDVPVRAVHAWTYSPPLVPSLVGYPYSAESFDDPIDERWEAEQRLERAAGEVGEQHDVERVVAEGSAAQVLIDAVGEADLLVVGSRGHGGSANLLLGSVSQQCAQHAPCPVAIVRNYGGD
jgi:nucleotide-binding universal stress UspA family protein